MIGLLILTAATFSGPAKLVMYYGTGGLQTASYATAPRCEVAKLALDAEAARIRQEFFRNNPQGIIPPSTVRAICIPG